MRKRFYILFVARDADGELRKIHIPLHYLYVFLAGTVIGMLTITGIAGSYARMALKVASFNQLRSEKEQLSTRYQRLERVAEEKDVQVASLGSLASEVSALYGLKSLPLSAQGSDSDMLNREQFTSSMDQLHALKRTALTGAATLAINSGFNHPVTITDWMRLSEAPTLWPVEGRITSAFGERIDPFNGEGAFHRGVDIASSYGHPVMAAADGKVSFADFMSGYGRMVAIEHGHGIHTRYAHLSGFTVVEGQTVKRGDIIGYVGTSGRSTGPHLHYEVWLHDTPVNPHNYLRTAKPSPNPDLASSAGAD